MPVTTETTSTSPKALWAGRIVSALVVLFMLFDSIIKLIKIEPVVQSFAQLGYPDRLAGSVGIIELICIALYTIPRTSVLGAVLLTGIMGGAIASHMRVGNPLFSHILFGVYLGGLAWLGLFLRDERVRTLIPLRR